MSDSDKLLRSAPNQEPAPALRGATRLRESMRRYTSWRAGGIAERVYVPADLPDLSLFLKQLPRDEAVTFVGLGSNLLVRDGGLRGTVILTHGALKRIGIETASLPQEIYAEAGVASPKVARVAALHDLEGGEFLAGIPGTIGGALAMNAGCYGHETWECVSRVLMVARDGALHLRTPREFLIGYRTVRSERDEFFAAAWMRFEQGDRVRSLGRIRELLSRRVATQPLGEPNAGSVFRNPPGDYAARLIESCGLKGYRVGAAEVSRKHANFIVNTGSARATDIESLIARVQAEVAARHGVALECEVRIIGEVT